MKMVVEKCEEICPDLSGQIFFPGIGLLFFTNKKSLIHQ